MMTLEEALKPIAQHRQSRVVMTTMSSVGAWPKLSDGPRDFAYLPSSMGQVVPLALGLALAQPGLGVVAISGDGGLLMNLGCLVTLAQYQVPVCVMLMDNGLYEVTGGQNVAGAGRIDFAGLAKASGIPNVWAFENLTDWTGNAEGCLNQPTPTFVWLKIEGRFGMATPTAPRPMKEQLDRVKSNVLNHNQLFTSRYIA